MVDHTTSAGAPVAPNAVTKGSQTLFHPTSAAALAAVLGAVTAFEQASPHPTSWVEWVTGGLAALSAAWAIIGPKASTAP